MNAGTTMTSSNDTEAPAKKNCPSCDRSGKIVAAITLDSLLTDEAKKRVPDKDGFRFCGTPDCPVAYYRSDDGMILETGEVRVSVFQKSSDPSRFACYCFNHSVEAIEVEVRRSGKSSVVAAIKEQCALGRSECARNNPQGSCCLGNVTRVVKAAIAGGDPEPDTGNCEEKCGCES